MEDLPKGLVLTTGRVSSELDDMDLVTVQDIAQLWKVYNANPSVHEGNLGFRLENFFWRIWGNQHILSSIRGSTLAKLFMRISEPSPSSIPTIQPLRKTQKNGSSSSNKNQDEAKSLEQSSKGTTARSPLPPILKKSNTNTSQGESQKTTRLLLTDLGGQIITRKPSTPPTPIPPALPITADSPSRQGQKKAYFVAGKAAKNAKRRPIIMRRKSSQTASSASSTRAQSPHPIPSPLTAEFRVKQSDQKDRDVSRSPSPEDNIVLPQRPETTATDKQPELPEAFVSGLKELIKTPPQGTNSAMSFPSSSTHRPRDLRYLVKENYEQPSSVSLVDKDFRTRFAERRRQEEIFLDTSSLGSSNLQVEALPGQSLNTMSSSTDTTETDLSPRFGASNGDASTAPSSTIPFMTSTSEGISNLSSFQNASLSLPRARSQLSLLIEQSRNSQAVSR